MLNYILVPAIMPGRFGGSIMSTEKLSPQQQAWVTRRQNAGQAAKPAADQPTPELHLTVTEGSDGQLTVALIADTELPASQQWRITAAATDGSLIGHETVRISLADVDAATLADVAKQIGSLQSAIEADRQASDDESFARTISFVAGYFKVKSVILTAAGDKVSEIRRGESYLKLHRFSEEFLKRRSIKQVA
jgi:hypothetical protein